MNSELSPLSAFALRGLKTCFQADKGRFSHAFQDFGAGGNISVPASDVFYSLNVILGLSRLPVSAYRDDFDLREIFERCCLSLKTLGAPTYAYGMALWASQESGLDLPGKTVDELREIVDDESGWGGFAAQDVGLLVSGLAHRSIVERAPWTGYVRRMYRFAVERFGNTPSGLFLNNANRWRGRYATFATGAYMTLAHFHFGEIFENRESIQRALQCVEALSRAQGRNGEWPWYYDAITGRVLDPYPVYSVHQDGMAPAYLCLAARHGYRDAHARIEHGFRWILGENELGVSMLDAGRGLIWRSQRRRENLQRYRRAARAVVRRYFGSEAGYLGPGRIEILRECRSYHLGWLLWSFGGNDDFSQLTSAPSFVDGRGGPTIG